MIHIIRCVELSIVLMEFCVIKKVMETGKFFKWDIWKPDLPNKKKLKEAS